MLNKYMLKFVLSFFCLQKNIKSLVKSFSEIEKKKKIIKSWKE